MLDATGSMSDSAENSGDVPADQLKSHKINSLGLLIFQLTFTSGDIHFWKWS